MKKNLINKEKAGLFQDKKKQETNYWYNHLFKSFINTPNFIWIWLSLLYWAVFQWVYRFFSYMYHVDTRTIFPNWVEKWDSWRDTFLADHNIYSENIEFMCTAWLCLLVFNFIISQIICVNDKTGHWISFIFYLLIYCFIWSHYVFKIGFSIY